MGFTSNHESETVNGPDRAICALKVPTERRVQSSADSSPVQGRIFLLATLFLGETTPLRQRRGLAVRRPKRAWLHVASAAGNECIEAETQKEPWCGH
jgi:hypothetical protein